jgi:menaquinone-dependent protoporphyrinogen oxidase
MTTKILITYASKYGATAEIAEKIGQTLIDVGLKADVLPVDKVRDLAIYKAVVLGSAVYIGKWHKEAVKFLQNNQINLVDRPVWLFSSGPTGDGDPVKLVEGLILPPNLQPIVDYIKPRDVAVFHGYINPDKINFIEKWAITKIVKKPMGDFRDWDTITSWANSIAKTLK